MQENVTPEAVVEFLNEILPLSPNTLYDLVERRVPCSKSLADHPTVQTTQEPDCARVGLMGILNGMFGVDENRRGPIYVQLNEDESKVVSFGLVKDLDL